MIETDNTVKQVHMIDHMQSLLEHNLLCCEHKTVTCIISQCKADERTPYALEIIDMIDPEHNHFILTANTLFHLLMFVPLDLTSFHLVPHVSDCEACLAYIANFTANATQPLKEN